jgi:hypothetical protein
MLTMARKAAIAVGLGAMMMTAAPVMADPGQGRGPDKHGWDNRGGPPHWAPAHGRRERDDWRRWRAYDYNRYPPGYSAYYADRYYRSGYDPIRVTRGTRIYRGYDGRYYCRRSDGTTGLILGAAIGGLIGNSLDRGRSSVAGTLIGAGAGALLGREIDRGELVCR